MESKSLCEDKISRSPYEDKTSGSTKYASIQVSDTGRAQTLHQVTWKQTLTAYIVCLASITLSCVSVVSVQILGGAMAEFELNMWRFGTQVIIILPVIAYRKCNLQVPKSKLLMVFAMFLCYNAFNVVFYTAAIYIATGTVFGLSSSLTIAGNAVFTVCNKKDRSLQLYLGALLSVLGILLISQPEFMFPGDILPPSPKVNFTSPCSPEDEAIIVTSSSAWLGYILASIAGLISCFSMQGVASFVDVVHPFTFAFWNALAGTIVSGIFMAALETPMVFTDFLCNALLLGHAIGTSQISVILPWCLQYLSPSVVAMINTLQLIVLLVLQYTALKDIRPGHDNWVEILGAVVCFSGLVLGPTWHIIKQKRSKETNIDV